MKSTIFQRRVVPAAIFVVIAASCVCCGAAGRWDGTVDAAFSYRTAERQTVVHAVPAGSFSERAGLQANDIVISVDGVDVTNATADEVIAAMRGPSGSVARLAISREGNVVEIAVERIPRAVKEKREAEKRPQ